MVLEVSVESVDDSFVDLGLFCSILITSSRVLRVLAKLYNRSLLDMW